MMKKVEKFLIEKEKNEKSGLYLDYFRNLKNVSAPVERSIEVATDIIAREDQKDIEETVIGTEEKGSAELYLNYFRNRQNTTAEENVSQGEVLVEYDDCYQPYFREVSGEFLASFDSARGFGM